MFQWDIGIDPVPVTLQNIWKIDTEDLQTATSHNRTIIALGCVGIQYCRTFGGMVTQPAQLPCQASHLMPWQQRLKYAPPSNTREVLAAAGLQDSSVGVTTRYLAVVCQGKDKDWSHGQKKSEHVSTRRQIKMGFKVRLCLERKAPEELMGLSPMWPLCSTQAGWEDVSYMGEAITFIQAVAEVCR